MDTYILYDSGCDIWLIEKYNPLISWHDFQYKALLEDCIDKKNRMPNQKFMNTNQLKVA